MYIKHRNGAKWSSTILYISTSCCCKLIATYNHFEWSKNMGNLKNEYISQVLHVTTLLPSLPIHIKYMKALQISQTDRVSAGIKIGSLTQKHLFCVDIYRSIKGYNSFTISFYKNIWEVVVKDLGWQISTEVASQKNLFDTLFKIS